MKVILESDEVDNTRQLKKSANKHGHRRGSSDKLTRSKPSGSVVVAFFSPVGPTIGGAA